ncbi:MAG: CPBP family intramembrane metalloprotease [Oscillospiraceae bacterium]|nr:CPBP family intramembrane metalloprotease [Oscillospiraceae bacterium]
MKPERRRFENAMSPLQTALGWLYFPLHLLALPLLLNIYVAWRAPDTSPVALNVAYLGMGWCFALLVMFSFLRRSFDAFIDAPGRCVRAMLLGFCADYVLSLAVVYIFRRIGAAPENPNDSYIMELATRDWGAIAAINIFLAPLLEEVLFRGVAFGSLRPRSRFWAYAVSTVLFSLGHVWQYAAAQRDALVLLYAFRYVPVSLVLAWCYEYSGSIWTSIFFHMAFNGLSFWVLS